MNEWKLTHAFRATIFMSIHWARAFALVHKTKPKKKWTREKKWRQQQQQLVFTNSYFLLWLSSFNGYRPLTHSRPFYVTRDACAWNTKNCKIFDDDNDVLCHKSLGLDGVFSFVKREAHIIVRHAAKYVRIRWCFYQTFIRIFDKIIQCHTGAHWLMCGTSSMEN